MVATITVPLQQSHSHQSDTGGTHQQQLWCFYTIPHSQATDLQKNRLNMIMTTILHVPICLQSNKITERFNRKQKKKKTQYIHTYIIHLIVFYRIHFMLLYDCLHSE